MRLLKAECTTSAPARRRARSPVYKVYLYIGERCIQVYIIHGRARARGDSGREASCSGARRGVLRSPGSPLTARTTARFRFVLFTFSLNTRKFVRLHELNFRVHNNFLRFQPKRLLVFLLLFLLFFTKSTSMSISCF